MNKKEKKHISSVDLLKMLRKSNQNQKTQEECYEICIFLDEWGKPVEICDIKSEIKRRGIYVKKDIRHFSTYRLDKMINSPYKLVSKLIDDGKIKYDFNYRLKIDKIVKLKLPYPWKQIIDLENEIDLFRRYAIESKNSKIISLFTNSLLELDLKLSEFIPILEDRRDKQKLIDTISVIGELISIYNEFKRIKRAPENEFWLYYNKFREPISEIKALKFNPKEESQR